MREIRQELFMGERPLFQGEFLKIYDTIFGEGESPLKESHDIELHGSSFKWKYPLWYAKNLTLINCTVESLQGMCYIDNLVMKNCKLLNTTLAFEYSTVDADIVGKIDSVLNPSGGVIRADYIEELKIEKDKVNPAKTKVICRQQGEAQINAAV